MQVVERHGGASHYLRPDRVYRTGVLSPTVNYSPGADVDAVATSFTQYPMDLQTSGMAGLGAPGWWDRMRMKWRMWNARRKARMGIRGFGGSADFAPGFDQNGIAYPQVGSQIAPHLFSMHQMVQAMTQAGLTPAQARSQGATSVEHWWNQRWNG